MMLENIPKSILRSDLTYICLDFETTGLDPAQDDAIQIGILSFDHTGKVTDTFSSYIKPRKDINELKDMVRVVTGLTIDDLATAPTFAEIADKVSAFFNEKTVIIGHNIQFDITVLEQYMSIHYLTSIDTFPLGQSLMPFAGSYALEVLDKSLSSKIHEETAHSSAHDALHDAYATKRVFLACIDRITAMVEKYPILSQYISKTDSGLSKAIYLPPLSLNDTLGETTPLLNKMYATDKKLISEHEMTKEDFPDKGKYYIGNSTLKDTLKVLPKENVIYAFSQRQKVQVAKNALHEIGLTQIDIGNQFIFDKKLLTLFLNKPAFDQGELYFTLKYFFHAFSGHSTIDFNNIFDRKIYHALKDTSSTHKAKSLELLTHEQLYEKMRDQEIMPYTTIYFFDQDRWYDTHMKWEQKPFDLYSLLQITDSLIYRDHILSSEQKSVWEPIHATLIVFLGVWQTEVAALLKDVSNSTVEVDSLTENTYFYKTNALLTQLQSSFELLETKVSTEDYHTFGDKWQRFTSIVTQGCVIMTKLYNDEVHFLVRTSNSFLEYSEFQQLFDTYQSEFLSHIKKDWPTIIQSTKADETSIVLPWPGKEKLAYTEKNIYIFSNNKTQSQDVLVWLHKHKPEKHKVHGENITGGKGKNIFAIKGSEYNIILGGYDFFLQCISQKITIDKVYTLCINGPLQHIISADLEYYVKQTIH